MEENDGDDGEPLEIFRWEFTEDVKKQFLVENLEYLEKIENDLLIRLDSNKNDREAIDEISRVGGSL